MFVVLSHCFLVIAYTMIVTLVSIRILDENHDQTDETMPDGSVQIFDVTVASKINTATNPRES